VKLIPIYLHPSTNINNAGNWARNVVHWFGVLGKVRIANPPYGTRHSFRGAALDAVCLGIVMAPEGAELVVPKWFGRAIPRLLAVPQADGSVVQLSAADVAEQASVVGCGLAWAKGRPANWDAVMAAGPRAMKREA
jgi:hypothetical protein